MLRGVDVSTLDKKERREMQMIFQDPYESLDPRMDVFNVLAEPLKVNDVTSGYREAWERVRKALEDVRLVPVEEFMRRFPHELSGGQRQRVACHR